MKFTRSFVVVLSVLVSLASSADARTHAALHGPSTLEVDVVIQVTPSPAPDLVGGWAVKALSVKRQRVGTTWVCSLRKPGDTNFVTMPSRGFTVDKPEMFWFTQLWIGEWGDGGDRTEVTSSTFQPWSVGQVATFRVDITSPEGVRTSVLADVLVGAQNPSIGPLKTASVSSDGRVIYLAPTGPFVFPVAMLYYQEVPVVGNNIEVSEAIMGHIPTTVRGSVPLVVGSGYPTSSSVTMMVAIPIL